MSDVLVLALVLLLVASGYAAGRVHGQVGYRDGYRAGYRQGYADGTRRRQPATSTSVVEFQLSRTEHVSRQRGSIAANVGERRTD